MQIKRSGSQPSAKGPGEWFTGTVRIDPLFPVTPPARAAGNAVTFEPAARTAWHTHPLGQILIVTFGLGWVQRDGGPVEEIVREMWCGSSRVKSTGTVHRRRLGCNTSRFKNRSMGKLSTGW